MDVYGEFWYGPSWTQEPDAQTFNIPAETNADWTVFDFPWPAVDGSAIGLRFWGGIVNNSGEL